MSSGALLVKRNGRKYYVAPCIRCGIEHEVRSLRDKTRSGRCWDCYVITRHPPKDENNQKVIKVLKESTN